MSSINFKNDSARGEDRSNKEFDTHDGDVMENSRHSLRAHDQPYRASYNSPAYMMGAGMGYGMGSMYGMGGYGGMGYGMGGMMAGPMQLIYSINYFISTISQMMDMLGMSSHAIFHLLQRLKEMLKAIEVSIRTSPTRRWLQQKCKKSAVLRFVLVIGSMIAAAQLSKLIKSLVKSQQHIQHNSDKLSN